MILEICVRWSDLDEIVNEIKSFENIDQVIIEEKNTIETSILSRKPNDQIELFDVLLGVVLKKLTEETYNFTKSKILEYLEKKNVQVKKIRKKHPKSKKK